MAISCRPDISYAVGRLSRFMHGPTDKAVNDCIHLLGYLKTPHHRLLCLEYRVHDYRLSKFLYEMHGDKSCALRGISRRLVNAQGKPLDAFTDSNL